MFFDRYINIGSVLQSLQKNLSKMDRQKCAKCEGYTVSAIFAFFKAQMTHTVKSLKKYIYILDNISLFAKKLYENFPAFLGCHPGFYRFF